MRSIYVLNIDQYLEIVELAQKNGVKPGESMEKEMAIIAQKYNLVPSCQTELNINELKEEYESKGKKVATREDIERISKGEKNV